jgi:hypothetical protein
MALKDADDGRMGLAACMHGVVWVEWHMGLAFGGTWSWMLS